MTIILPYKDIEGNTIGAAHISSLPGCSQIAVIHNAYIHPSRRGQGLGTMAHIERLKQLKSLGYSAALCTVVKDNGRELEILRRNNWVSHTESFISPVSWKEISLYFKILVR